MHHIAQLIITHLSVQSISSCLDWRVTLLKHIVHNTIIDGFRWVRGHPCMRCPQTLSAWAERERHNPAQRSKHFLRSRFSFCSHSTFSTISAHHVIPLPSLHTAFSVRFAVLRSTHAPRKRKSYLNPDHKPIFLHLCWQRVWGIRKRRGKIKSNRTATPWIRQFTFETLHVLQWRE